MAPRSTYNAKDAAEIAERLSKGEPLTHICRDNWLPCDDTVRAWASENPEFGRAIARAREAGFDAIAHDALTIADDKTGDHNRDRLRVDTRLKLLAKWDPKRYGDKIDHSVQGDVTVTIQTGVPRDDG